MPRMLRALFLAGALLVADARASESTLVDAYDRLLAKMQVIAAEPSSDPRDERMYMAYLHAVAPYRDGNAVHAFSGRDLYYLQLMAEASLFYSYREQVAVDAERFYRHAVDAKEFDASASRIFYRSMLLAGEWEKAREVEDRLVSSVSVIRVLQGGGQAEGRAVLTPVAADVLEATSVQPLRDGVYVVGHHGCAWTRKALTDILAQPDLKEFLAGRSLFLAPRNTVLQGSQDANRFPTFQIVMDPRQWPEIGSWDLPTFVFVENGEVVDGFSGWASQDALQAFRAGMHRIE